MVGRCGHRRQPDAIDVELDDPGRPVLPQLLPKPSGAKFESDEPLIEQHRPLVVDWRRRVRPAIHPSPGQPLKQLARSQGSPLGGAKVTKVTMDGCEEQPRVAPGKG